MPITAHVATATATPIRRAPAPAPFKPWVGESTKTAGLVVLFMAAGHGLVVFPGASKEYQTGYSNMTNGKNWKAANFRPFNGLVFTEALPAKPAAERQPAYPFLANSDKRPGLIVLVAGPGRDSKSLSGTVLVNSNPKRTDHGVGYTSNAWKRSRLSVFKGELKLRG